MSVPLAEKMRPANLDDYLGQEHLTGEGAVLRKMIDNGRCHSMIFWGPPGSGKTTLANIIARKVSSKFIRLSAINAGVRDIRSAIETAEKLIQDGEASPVLFIDEIHRFNKTQQDALLGSVENGTLILIGATTENPSFEVISPLLSRCQVYVLKSLEKNDLEKLLERALLHFRAEYPDKKIAIRGSEALLLLSGGDARKLFNALDIVVQSMSSDDTIEITNEMVMESVQANIAMYDKSGEMHYDIISAFIKSIRGSDPDAAVYYLARMVEGGEDPKFICRRMIILAAEDIGLANPNALLIANACFDAVHKIGYPEARIIMAEAAIYLACSPKSNSAYMAIDSAIQNTRKYRELSVPLHLRNAPTGLMKDLGYGHDYKYSHDFQGNFARQQYLPDSIKNASFYKPQENEHENKLRKWLAALWQNRFNSNKNIKK